MTARRTTAARRMTAWRSTTRRTTTRRSTTRRTTTRRSTAAGIAPFPAAPRVQGSSEIGRKRIESIGNFRRQVAIAGRCTESDESAHECVFGHRLAAIGQRDLLNDGLKFRDIDLHTYSLHSGPFVVLAIRTSSECHPLTMTRCGGATLTRIIHATFKDNPPSDFFP